MTPSGNVLIAGVGGQGVLLASDVLAAVCLAQGCDVKKSDVHGMAQRGGIVFSHVRFGSIVHSPMIEEGQADAVVAMEWAEALRWTSYLREGGAVITDAARIVPPVACGDRRAWRTGYPRADLALLHGRALEPGTGNREPETDRVVYVVDARAVAKASGVARAANVVLLGTLSTRLEFPLEAWESALQRIVPRGSVDANLKAFHAGRQVMPETGNREPGTGNRKADPGPWTPDPARDVARFTVEVTEAWCKGCDICVRLCPEDCLRLDGDGIAYLASPEACTGCRLCEWLCPDFAITVRGQEVASHA